METLSESMVKNRDVIQLNHEQKTEVTDNEMRSIGLNQMYDNRQERKSQTASHDGYSRKSAQIHITGTSIVKDSRRYLMHKSKWLI